jgi:hypothetical protein
MKAGQSGGIFSRQRVVRGREIRGEVVMTQVSIHAPRQESRLNTYVVGAFMAAVLVLSAVMFLSPFAA